MPQWIRAAEDPPVEPLPAPVAHTLLRLSWLPWIVLAIGLLGTLAGIGGAEIYASAGFEQRFHERTDRLTHWILTRIRVYEQMLRSAAGLIDLPGRVSPDDWRRYAAQLDLQNVYPGVLAIGFIELVDPENLARHETLQRRFRRTDYAVHPPRAARAARPHRSHRAGDRGEPGGHRL